MPWRTCYVAGGHVVSIAWGMGFHQAALTRSPSAPMVRFYLKTSILTSFTPDEEPMEE